MNIYNEELPHGLKRIVCIFCHERQDGRVIRLQVRQVVYHVEKRRMFVLGQAFLMTSCC